MQLVFTIRAELDLEEIGDTIATDNPSRAVSFVREIREHCAKIALSPLGYAARPELGEGIRGCPHKRYVILFRPSADEVLIIRILHGSRDLPALFKR